MINFEELRTREKPLAVMGLGYVGLPLAIEFAKKYDVIGFDVNETRIRELRSGQDHTREARPEDLAKTTIHFTSDPRMLKDCGVIIIAVPTPIDKHRNPDLTPVVSATRLAGKNMGSGTVVVYESTVYPGLTEEICVPILEEESGLKFGRDFTVGYSPERINPGDRQHTLTTITKIVSGSDKPTLELLARLYGSIIEAGVHKAPSIRVAEAAKVIENTQRDVNIALMNELSSIFNRMGIDTLDVLEAAGTKWNFLHYRPGMVGGHCIGVDPYYLTFKAEELGFHPEVILAGRRINDRMGKYVAENAIKRLIANGIRINGAKIGVFGLTFKENVPDLRNTRVVDLVDELRSYGANVIIHDSEAHPGEAKREYEIELASLEEMRDLDAAVIAVGHDVYRGFTPQDLKNMYRQDAPLPIIDVKGILDKKAFQAAGFDYWRL